MNFTESQKQVIDLRNKNILVSAAAGSGKTAVLVERILGLITDPVAPVDIDRLLIVTFTNAAATEMRERIGSAIEKRLQQDPENDNLLRQITLLHHAQITTIDSFCLFLVKNHFHEIGLDPGFRVADPGEIQLLKQDCLKEIIEESLEEEEGAEAFRHMMDAVAYGTREKNLEEAVLKLHLFSESFPWPEEWLKDRLGDYDIETEIQDTVWGKELEEIFQQRLGQILETIATAIKICTGPGGPYMHLPMLQEDEELAERLKKSGWRNSFSQVEEISFKALSRKKDEAVSEELRESVKILREQAKNDLKKLKEELFPAPYEKILQQMKEIAAVEKVLVETVIKFRKRFLEKKREKNLLDFSDMEHLALEILLQKPEGEEELMPTKTALEYQSYYKEIMVDEYQDSNLVQELLLQSIASDHPNRFMVGDLKQSIYKFRLARPEIFLEKYNTYGKEADNPNQRVDLHQNFRSRREVLDSVNDVFYQIMGKDLGKVDYTRKEALFVGASYPDTGENYKTTLLLMEEGEEDKKEAEAAMVAGQIQRMVGKFLVTDKETGLPRPLKYSDIVVLLRTNTGWDEVFYRIFMERKIPAAVTNKAGYFSAIEVQTLLGFLRTLDNPFQDIPLYGTLRSFFGRFSEEEIVALKAEGKKSLYENLKKVAEVIGEEAEEGEKERHSLSLKAADFLRRLNKYRDQVYILPIHKLLRKYLEDTGYLYYCRALPGGEQRVANIKMLLEKAEVYEKTSYFGLFHFLRYMEQLQKYEIDAPEAGIMDEGSEVVRIMSIHKSKGLEFPVCFLSGLSKQINQQDSRESILCDMDLGIGMDYRDTNRRIRKKDLRKNILAEKIRRENLGEELRVLYVAMTRAREKLIMTGVIKDYEKQLATLASLKDHSEEKLPLPVLNHATNYLDLILAASIRRAQNLEIRLENPFLLTEEQLAEPIEKLLKKEEAQDVMDRLSSEGKQKELGEALRKSFCFNYAYENLKGLFVKTTVSELKMKAMEEKDEAAYQLFEEAPVRNYLPGFVEEKKENEGAKRGNAYHRVMELMDFSKLPSIKALWEQLEKLSKEEILKPEYLSLLQKKKLEAFLKSALAKRMEKAANKELLWKEQPFVLGVPANVLDKKFPEEEKVLIQGIIDAYFEEEEELVVLDYKTDRVSTEEELVNRYEEQLNHYARALTRLTGKRVKEKLLYSFSLDRIIEIKG